MYLKYILSIMLDNFNIIIVLGNIIKNMLKHMYHLEDNKDEHIQYINLEYNEDKDQFDRFLNNKRYFLDINHNIFH